MDPSPEISPAIGPEISPEIASNSAPARLALIELQGRDERPLRAVDVLRWPLTLGRALDNDIVLDDPHAAPYHARLQADGQGRVTLFALKSLNGVSVDGRRVNDEQTLPAGGAVLQLGASRLRLRLPGEVLAPEQPLPAGLHAPRALPWLAGAALLALQAGGQWLGLDPGADYSSWLPSLIGLPVAIALWCGLWALMSKLFQHRFDFAGHLRIAVPWLVAVGVVETFLPQIAAALSMPTLWQLAGPATAVLAALMVRAHLGHVLPLHQRAVTATVAALALGSAAISLALTWRSHDSLRSAPYMSTLPLPALRLAGTVPVAQLVKEMTPLAEALNQRVKKAKADNEDDGDGE